MSTKHICGEREDATGPSRAHYAWHYRRGDPRCGKALQEYAWYWAEAKSESPIPIFVPDRNRDGYQCGTEADAVAPSRNHYKWHKYAGTPVCGLAQREYGWAIAESHAGRVIEDYQPARHQGGYVCGAAADAESASGGHYGWHRWFGTQPCAKSLAEKAWEAAERRAGRKLDSHVPFAQDVPTTVYQITFLDGDRYYGLTSLLPETRWKEHQVADTPVGRKIRSGTVFVTEVLCVAPNRRQAAEIERMAIKAGNPWGNLLNIQHNEEVVDV